MAKCSRCGTATLQFGIPEELVEYFPDERPGAGLCPHCFAVMPVDDPPSERPNFQAEVSEAFPRDQDDAALLACILALLDHPTIHRQELHRLLDRAERHGVDVFLALDRLAADSAIEPHFDLRRRRRQLEQLL